MGQRRKIFFNSLLICAIICSIFTAAKLTVVINIPIACSFFIFPLSFLSLSVINELGGGKVALRTLISATLILLIAYILITICVTLPNQVTTINEANALQLVTGSSEYQGLYIPSFRLIIGSVLGLLISGLISIGIYSSLSKYTFKTMSCFLATLISLLVFNAIYVVATQLSVLESHDFIMMLLNRFIFSVIWTVIISILFLIFSHHKEKKEIETENIEATNELKSEPEKVINEKQKKETSKNKEKKK